MAYAFLSHAREDADAAEKLARFLTRNGVDVWWDRRLRAADDIDEVIDREIDRATCVVVLWSPHSVASHRVKGEAQTALDASNLDPDAKSAITWLVVIAGVAYFHFIWPRKGQHRAVRSSAPAPPRTAPATRASTSCPPHCAGTLRAPARDRPAGTSRPRAH